MSIRYLSRFVIVALLMATIVTFTFANGQKESTGTAASSSSQVKVGLVVKDLTNPYWVTMIKAAKQYAAEKGIQLQTAAGNYDGDNATQITAMENMASAGIKGILVTPNQSSAIVPTIEKLRKQGEVIIALDTPTAPENATNGLFATDNKAAAKLDGEYAKAYMAQNGETPVIALMDGTPGTTVSQLRHDGWLEGFGITDKSPMVVCAQATNGTLEKAQTAMENCLTKDPNINLVYAINEPAGFGAYKAIQNAGKQNNIIITAIDGSCTGIKGVQSGQFIADVMQFPGKMATMGIDAIMKFAETGTMPSGYVNTGAALITDKPLSAVKSEPVSWGLTNCWGQ